MADDLVVRLRRRGTTYSRGGISMDAAGKNTSDSETHFSPEALSHEAADEITRLQSRVAELEAALREINGCVGGPWERFDAVVSAAAAALAAPAKAQVERERADG